MTVPKLLQSYYETEEKNKEDILAKTLEDATAVQETVTPQVPKLLESYYQPRQEDISFSREFSYGTAQEMTALGSAYQLTKAGVQAAQRNHRQIRSREGNGHGADHCGHC